jgi:hypothetical protein
MSTWHEPKVNLGFLVNPFYLYCIAFSLAIFLYFWGWSDIFPKLSIGLIFFFSISFLLFILAGYLFGKGSLLNLDQRVYYPYLNDVAFGVIISLGLLNVLLMGYLPILDRSYDYREFGAPVIDPLFNTLSIFFSVFYFQSFLDKKKKRFLFYIVIILIFQVLIFRRSTVMWIFTSSSFLYLIYKQRIRLVYIVVCILSIPLLSYCFGSYGNIRGNLSKEVIMNDLGPSNAFKSSGISVNHYMTYLYVSSPLANLQKNINKGEGIFNHGEIKNFLLYCVIPQSVTIRLEKRWNLEQPVSDLITYQLIAGTIFMISFYTLGWPGIIMMLFYLVILMGICLFLIKKWNMFSITTYAILCTTVCLSIFTNFINRADVLLMLFVYPILFHFLFIGRNKLNSITLSNAT